MGKSKHDFTAEQIEFWIKAYQRDLRCETYASPSVKLSWRIAIAGMKLLLKEVQGRTP